MNNNYPFSASGFKVDHPFGSFVVTALPARVLLDTAYSDRLTAIRDEMGNYTVSGSQRVLAEPRLKDIGKFIDTGAACFPNAIILAANYREGDGLVEEDEDLKWEFSPEHSPSVGKLLIPSAIKLAAIIDGQHRLFGFNFISKLERLDMPMVCAIFFDLPKPYQARLFATINSTQRPVSKSQTYELFGYNIEEEPAKKWTPEKLAVFMARKLNADSSSPFYQHMVVPAENDFSTTLAAARRTGDWAVSMATIVEGIVRLISLNPKRDAYKMAGEVQYEGHDRRILETVNLELTPLRDLYREYNDEVLHMALLNFFKAVDQTLWSSATTGSYIRKTVGIQALFDLSRPLLCDGVRIRDLRVDRFAEVLKAAQQIDFSDTFYHASGASRTAIRKTLEYALGLKTLVNEANDYAEYRRILGNIH
jgi:DNA phosphorothioation-associated DGQHR protein 1